MSITDDIGFSTPILVLSEAERNTVGEVARKLLSSGRNGLNSPEWTEAASAGWQDLPAATRRRLARFRRDSGAEGALLVRGLPVDESLLPDTPSASGSVQLAPTVPAALLTMFACGLGDPAAFLAEKSGALVQDVVPVPGNENFQGNEGSVLLSLHNENAFHRHRPDYVLLLCLRADHERVAGLRVACIRRARPQLSASCLRALHRAEFVTSPPPSFGSGQDAPAHAVLGGDPEDPDIVVDFAATRPLTESAGEALLELHAALSNTADTYYPAPGDLAIVDNHVALHGRTAFTPRYDGRDRWLQRSFSLRDLRRSRDHRPGDGPVLVR
ncbi:clavaminate synthase family protein [Kutzneria viridogrisea]|uniref:L-asparagine oxygenase n=1 Tax=Kutzneria viridogrisea TaxID=47990 RepID=A0ABR6B8L9_9PSEU|nr:L-asparagine oxygenase [Kutzneria viridogrisea]